MIRHSEGAMLDDNRYSPVTVFENRCLYIFTTIGKDEYISFYNNLNRELSVGTAESRYIFTTIGKEEYLNFYRDRK